MNRDTEKKLVEDLKSIVILEGMQGENDTLVIEPELKEGTEVCVKTGPMRGLTGVIEKRKGVHRIVVNVEIISQSVTMEMDVCDVEMEY